MSATLTVAVRGATAAMGTRFEIVVGTDDERGVRPLVEAALREIDELHGKLTRFSRDSLLSHINRTAGYRPVRLDSALFELFESALCVHQQSGGAFDIALGSGRVLLDPHARAIAFDRPEAALDLGGIAKGFALDRAAAILRDGGVDSALLHGGTSSVVTIGAPPDGPAWRVALSRAHARRVVELRDQALSVSRPFSQGMGDRTHIVDPRSRDTVRVARFAAVIGPSACLADAWSTALSVLGYRPPGLGDQWTAWVDHE